MSNLILDYFKDKKIPEYSENAINIYEKLYFCPDLEETKIEQVHKRIAKALSNNEDEEKTFEVMLNHKLFRPNTPIFINAGANRKNDYNNIYSACHIFGLEDTMESIIDLWGTAAKIYAGGAGIGFNMTNLRAKGTKITSGGVASGPRSYSEVLDVISDTVKAGNRCLAPYQRIFTSKGVKTIKELSELDEKFAIISFDSKNNRMTAKLGSAYKSGIKKIYALKTNKGEFHLTSNHPIKMADGSYKLLQNIKPGMKLFLCSIYNVDGYLTVSLRDGKRGKEKFHRLIGEDILNLDNNIHYHHKDGNKRNNNLDNIEPITQSEHSKKHSNKLVEQEVSPFQLNQCGHIVESITYVKTTVVYDINVECSSPNDLSEQDSHNFAIMDINSDLDTGCGIIVHNSRRAANLGAINYNHQDIKELIQCKLDGKTLQNFNLSVLVDDFFMNTVNNIMGEYELSDYKISYVCPKNGELNETISCKDLWNLIIENCWKNGDPGLLFYDTAKKFNPFPNTKDITASNPCSEVLLWDWTTCILGSINVNAFYQNKQFNWELLEKVIYYATIFLNNAIDKTAYVHPLFEKTMKENRPIGLGLMGLSDLFINLGLPYDSDEAFKVASKIVKFININSIKTSIEIAEYYPEKRIKIPEQDYDNFLKLLHNEFNIPSSFISDIEKHGIANCVNTCIAPTGSVSISADCSYSWEPLFGLVWEKKLVKDINGNQKTMTFINEKLKNELNSILPSNKIEELIEDIKNNNGSIQGLTKKYNISSNFEEIYKVAHDINPFKKIELQGVLQEHIGMAISGTVNVPKETTKETIGKLFLHAWKNGLKGITIYRDCCREWQPVNFGEIKKEEIIEDNKNRPIKTNGSTYKIKTPYGDLYITCNSDVNNKPTEIFLELGKCGQHENLLYDTIATLVSHMLRNGMKVENIVNKIFNGRKSEKLFFKLEEDQEIPYTAESIIEAIGMTMQHHFNNEEPKVIATDKTLKCPNCGGVLQRNGCRNGGICPDCGYSSCS